ncbi:MAG: sulfatase-like hydrolase/transferase [Spirochaetales bacterium]|nr:sulfatase-like hydrolase/transferase [Spirochaetales bacterium]
MWLLALLAYSHSGADLCYRAYLSPSLQYFFLRGWHDLDLTLASLMNLTGLLLFARVLWHTQQTFLSRVPYGRWAAAILTGAVTLFFLLRFIVWHTLQIQTDGQVLLFLMEHLSLLSQAPSVLREVAAAAWVFAAGAFIPLFFLVLEKKESRPLRFSTWQARAFQTAAAVLLFLAVQLDLHAALLRTGKEEDSAHPADWPGREDIRPQKKRPEFFFQKRFGFQLPLPRVFVIFILESARQEFVDVNRSRYFGKSKESLSIKDFFVPVPHSSNSHYSLFTGLHSSRRAQENFPAIDVQSSLPGSLAKKGFRTIYLYGGDSRFDKEHTMLDALQMENMDMARLKRKYKRDKLFWWGMDDRLLIQEAREIVEQERKPVFLTIVYTNSHHPYPALPGRQMNRFSTEDGRGRHRNAIDYAMELSDELLDFLKERNESTFAILLSDHGESFGEHGFIMHDFSLYNTEIQIPFAMYSPQFRHLFGDLPDEGTILDVWPTLADLFGLPLEAPLHGRSLFDPAYNLNLVLRSWTNTDYTGLIYGKRKWIYSAPARRLTLLERNDRPEKEFSRSEARAFIDDLNAVLP